MSKPKKEGRYVCRCTCGGEVRGVEQFGLLWTWCERCTPVVQVRWPADRVSTPSQTQDTK